ncbi:MAG: amidohydrolase family protein [Acidobacteria bacterium]|nr:amidohydrolase family protein [Acidobacteriota bacterium]
MSLLLKNALIVTMNDGFEVVQGDVSVREGRIAAVGVVPDAPHDRVIDAEGDYVLPGLIQTHIHLCQTLFRGYADDMPLMQWLRTRVWPMEAAHTAASLRAAARLATTELLASGTTAVLTMETVHETDAVFEAVAESGIRATIGKCMMDADADVPSRLKEHTRTSLDESVALYRRWHNTSDGRIRAALAPRFAVSCTRELLEGVAALSTAHQALVHTHASESRDEIAIVRQISGGLSNLAYLDSLKLATPHLCAAHCVWADDAEQEMLARRDVKVMHCPSSNLKLGSGIAPVAEMRRRGITVSLGADGAACNNRLDMFDEMRLAAMLQAVHHHPGALSARDALWMATRAGAARLRWSTTSVRLKSARRPTSSGFGGASRTSRLIQTPTPLSCTRRVAPTSSPASSTARCLSTRVRRPASRGRRSRSRPGPPHGSWPFAPVYNPLAVSVEEC